MSRDTLHLAMIKTFADRRPRDLFLSGSAKRFPADVAPRAARKLEYVDLAASLDDLRVTPGNRLHALKQDRKGQHAISINDAGTTQHRESLSRRWREQPRLLLPPLHVYSDHEKP